jgi:hypothetical protein
MENMIEKTHQKRSDICEVLHISNKTILQGSSISIIAFIALLVGVVYSVSANAMCIIIVVTIPLIVIGIIYMRDDFKWE